MFAPEDSVLANASRLIGAFEEITKIILETQDFSAAALLAPLLERVRHDTDDC